MLTRLFQVEAASPPRQSGGETVLLAWRLTAWVAGVFSLLVGITLLVEHTRAKPNDLLQPPQLIAAKEQLRLDPTNPQLKQDIRELDWRLRQRYFRHLALMGFGVHLLAGGVIVLVLAMMQAARCRKRVPLPGPKAAIPHPAARFAARARWAVAACGIVVGSGLFVLSRALGPNLPTPAAELDKLLATRPEESSSPGHPQAADAASLAELRQNWPRFLGADGNSFSPSTNAPASWNPQTGAGIAWKVPTPTRGFGSPIVWAGQVFLSGGDARQREVICLDAQTGKILWQQPVASVSDRPDRTEVPDSTGYAAPTMATDGRRVYAFFANGDCAAFTLAGQPAWARNFGPLKNPYGHATSLATWRDRLILQLDQGESADGNSKLYALDARTGQTVWQRPRKTGATWATPNVIDAEGKAQVIALSVPWVIAYAAADGAEVWRAECLNGEIAPSPACAGGLLFVASPSEKLLAIRPSGQGDITQTHLLWTWEDSIPDVTSPASDGELVFILTTSGMLTCLDARDGKKQWEHDLEMECHASPALAAGRLYLFGQKGTAVVVAAAREFRELFRTEMGDAFHASPAFVQDRMFLRGMTNVWCVRTINEAGKEGAQP